MSLFEGLNLTCERGDRLVFAQLSFRIGAGDALLLTGPNGSGKSSLLRLMAGLINPRSGEIRWQGLPVARDLPAHRERLHFVGHLDATKPTLTTAEDLDFWSGMRGARQEAEAALARFGLATLADLPCRYLSAGQRKRLSLARLLADPAPLWLLDEPTNGLDAAALASLEAILAEHRAKGGMVVAATHTPLALPGAALLRLEDFAPAAPRTEWNGV